MTFQSSQRQFLAAVERAVALAEEAKDRGTFGVGGVAIDRDGNILFESGNQVIRTNPDTGLAFTHDPSGHVETLLFEALADKISRGDYIPPFEDIMFITSLEPCLMCCGGSLITRQSPPRIRSIAAGGALDFTKGMGVFGLSFDAFAGFTKGTGEKPNALPPGLHPDAAKVFSFPKGERIKGAGFYCEAERNNPFADVEIPPELVKRALRIFLSTLETVRERVHNAGADIAFEDIGHLPSGHPLIKSLGVGAQISAGMAAEVSLDFITALCDAATETNKSGQGSLDAAALVAPDGSVLMIRTGRECTASRRTPVALLLREYSQLRWLAATAADGTREKDWLKHLPHPKDCTMFTLMGPGNDAAAMVSIGVYGSTMEDKLPPRDATQFRHWQYIIPRLRSSELDRIIGKLPPFYNQLVGISPAFLDEAMKRHASGVLRRNGVGHNLPPDVSSKSPVLQSLVAQR